MACRCALDSLYRYMYLHLGTYHNLLWHLPDSSQAQPLFDEQFVTCLSVQYFHLKSKEIRENFSGMIKKLKRNLIVLYTEINFLPNIVYWSRILLFCVQIHLLFFWRHYIHVTLKKNSTVIIHYCNFLVCFGGISALFDRAMVHIVMSAGNNNFHSKSTTTNGLITCLLAFTLTVHVKSTRVPTLLHNASPLYILCYAYISHSNSLLAITILALVWVSHSNTTVIHFSSRTLARAITIDFITIF